MMQAGVSLFKAEATAVFKVARTNTRNMLRPLPITMRRQHQ